MQILFVVIHMVYQEKTQVPGRTVRETRCLGVTAVGVGMGLGTICLPHKGRYFRDFLGARPLFELSAIGRP